LAELPESLKSVVVSDSNEKKQKGSQLRNILHADISNKGILSELVTLEWWITGLMLDQLFFLISRLNIACSPLYINLQINLPIGIRNIPF